MTKKFHLAFKTELLSVVFRTQTQVLEHGNQPQKLEGSLSINLFAMLSHG